MKRLAKKYFKNFVWFYSYLRYKIFAAFFLSIIVGFLDGFGLTMFLPLLKIFNGDGEVSFEGMGNLSFISEWIEKLGFELSIVSVLQFMTLFFVLKAIVKYINDVFRVLLQKQLIQKIRIGLLNSINEINFKFFASSDIGRIQNTMTGELTRVQSAYVYYFQMLEHFVLVTVYMIFAFYVDYKFAILITIGGILTNFFYKAIHKITQGVSKQFSSENNIFEGQVIQHITNFKYLRATGMADSFATRLIKTINEIEVSRKKLGFLSSLLVAVREPLLIIIVSIVILLQIYLFKGDLAPIVISLLFFFRALNSLTQLQHAKNMFLSQSGSIENLQLFQADLKENKQDSSGKDGYQFNDTIELSSVSLSYNDINILKDINLKINKNQSVAIVGESGSGKTTLVNLISGLIPCDSGKILVDGKNTKGINKIEFQKKIGYITQEPVIFNDSIFNNITFWAQKNEENLKRFNYAIQKASLFDTIDNMPLKEESLLGNNGINLSGGQKQRISIARELYKDVEILIMDEATSALDYETEKSIQENIEALKGEYTMLTVAHRLSTIRSADTIILMGNGKIIETGSFSEVMENQPNFKTMVESQNTFKN